MRIPLRGQRSGRAVLVHSRHAAGPHHGHRRAGFRPALAAHVRQAARRSDRRSRRRSSRCARSPTPTPMPQRVVIVRTREQQLAARLHRSQAARRFAGRGRRPRKDTVPPDSAALARADSIARVRRDATAWPRAERTAARGSRRLLTLAGGRAARGGHHAATQAVTPDTHERTADRLRPGARRPRPAYRASKRETSRRSADVLGTARRAVSHRPSATRPATRDSTAASAVRQPRSIARSTPPTRPERRRRGSPRGQREPRRLLRGP